MVWFETEVDTCFCGTEGKTNVVPVVATTGRDSVGLVLSTDESAEVEPTELVALIELEGATVVTAVWVVWVADEQPPIKTVISKGATNFISRNSTNLNRTSRLKRL